MALPRLGTNPVLLFRLSLTFTVIESSRPTDWTSRPFSALPSSDHNELKLRGDLQLSCLCEFILARIMDQTTPSYGIGTKLTIYRHLAPEPTAPGYQHCRPADFEEEAQTTFTERYLKHPPLQGTTLWSQPFSITITDEITPNSTSGARLLGVNNKLVAKIYDPLYYSIPTLSNEVGTNPFRLADSDYTHETAAYERTNYRLGGTILPEYHGSFTCKLSVISASGTTTRSVRLILLERILGTCMRDLDPHRTFIPQHQRKALMAKIVDADSLLSSHGVSHGDLHPRNVMLCGSDLDDTNLRVVLIDLGCSYLSDGNSGDDDPGDDTRLPVSPVLSWDVRRLVHTNFEALGWIDWDWQAWLEEQWSDSKAYAPITDVSRKRWLGFFYKPATRSPKWWANWTVVPDQT